MGSVFTAIRNYLVDTFQGARSALGSCFTAVPYLFSAGELRKEVTEQYPDPISSKTVDDLPPRTRGLLFNEIDRCTGCRECEKVCPTQCIHLETDQGADETKVWVAVFDIDYSRCIFCGLCTEVCLPDSLNHTKRYEGAVGEVSEMVARYGKGHVTPEQREKWMTMRKLRESEGRLS